MKRTWQLQDAKNRLSVVVNRALTDGAQTITRHGRPVVVVLSAVEFNKLRQPKKTLSRFFAELPLKGIKLDLERDKTPARDTEL